MCRMPVCLCRIKNGLHLWSILVLDCIRIPAIPCSATDFSREQGNRQSRGTNLFLIMKPTYGLNVESSLLGLQGSHLKSFWGFLRNTGFFGGVADMKQASPLSHLED